MKTNRYILFFALLFALFSTQAEDYYWVGGTGLWSDLNSWRTPSGQIPNEVPDGSDNVFFNENSFIAPFDTVFILTGNPTCNNMTWSNIIDTVVIIGGANTTNFNIFGSVTMHPKVRNWYYGKISFLSENPGNTITCAKTVFKGDLRFEGAGEWILQDTLFVHDSTDWKYIIEDFQEPLDPNPIILHTNGRLDANGQTIICRGFATTGNKPREFDFENAHALLLGNWTLNAENLAFNGSNSYIYFGGEMSNLKGDEIHYYDIDVMPVDGAIKNTDIRTFHRKIHFLGSGSIDGKKTPGVEGSFTIDTLIFEGAITMMGPIPCEVKGPYHDIHYTLVNVVDGHFDVKEGYFHRIDFWGSDFGRQLPSDFRGLNSVADSIHFFRPMGQVFGYNTINNLLFFKTIGTISAEVLQENTVNHAVFSGDGIFEGTNNFDLLTLNTGYRYQIACDSLFLPGSTYTYTNVQNINGLEVVGDCDNGLCYLSSKMKPAVAIINYTGGALATEYLFVRDILNMGDPINITNGVDGGNNQNINFTNPLQGRTLYWVNGQGEWSRRNHWSLSSGGVGDQCPPTILDDVFFDNGSGFNADTDTSVFVNLPHLYCNDMTWVDGLSSHVYLQSFDTAIDITFNTDSMAIQYDTVVNYYDTTSLYIAGSIELDTAMSFLFLGDVHFISDNDDDYEILDLKYTYGGEVYWDFHKKTYFNGEGGKWRLQENTKFYNNYDTVYFQMGEILIDDDSVSFYSFTSLDTLPRRLSLLNKTLVEVRMYQGDAWNVNASYSLNGDTLFFLDAGRSTIRSLGDIFPPPLQPPGFCHIRTYGGELDYWNIEFGWQEQQGGMRSMLKSESKCTYNLVDYYYSYCDGVGTGVIDTLTWKPSSTGSRLRNNFWINFVMAYGFGDTLMQSHIIDTAMFFNEGGLYGGHFIGYLEAREFLGIQYVNQIDTAVLKGNAEILGRNTFSQLVLEPNKRYIFQHETGAGYDTTIIKDDFIVDGFCDEPIRLQSDSIGTIAKILYKRQNPSYTDFTANNVSMRDISMLPHNGIEYIATNSVDLGNNENWTFVESNNSVYYWIGGQGKWGDWQHWSYSSGGPPIEDKCTPKEINTVVFDDNSFERANDTVYIDVRNAYCNNMYWVHSEADFKPTFLGADTTVLFVYGSMMLNDSMNYEYYGEVFFDQFNDPGGQPDTIYSKGHTFWNDIYLQGIDDIVVMDDDLTLFVDPGNQIYRVVHHNQGEFRLNENHMRTGGYYSLFKSQRALNMTNSQATVLYDFERAWWVEGENFELLADNSTIFNESFMGTVVTENGDYFKYNDVIFKGPVDSLYNKNNTVEYNIVDIQMESGLVAGNFIADSVLMNGSNSGMFQTSNTNVVMINAMNGSINNNHTVGRAVVNKFGFIRGANTFDHCVFFDDGVFMGKNVFDTLVLYPGVGDFQNQGNWFYFEADTAQVVIDSLYLRGNQCSNINITSLSQPNMAYIRKNNGVADVSCDFLNIYSVAAQSENLEFYAGTNSTPLPNPDNPPPGWIFDNAQGYIPGFNGRTERFCQGEPYVIDATSFNGDPSTQYFWEGSQYPGNPDYTITEPGTYHIRVQYFEGCYVDDYIVMEGDFPPEASIPEGPYCEGEPIEVNVSPDNSNYQYKWWNGETTATIEAKVQYTGGIYVAVTDPTNNCKATPNQTIVVKPTPDPEDALGNDITIKYGESITLDAGFGDYYEWTSTPEVPIDNPNQREITVPGYIEPIEYKAYVEIDGCPAEGFKVVTMYPPSKLGVPTAFSPNGDGVNDELKILGSGFDKIDFKIFNRYGELVFETNDAEISWDGTYKGKKQEMDVYTYYIKVIYLDKGVVEESGNISLLR